MTILFITLILVFFAQPSCAVGSDELPPDSVLALEARVRVINQSLRCPVCQNQSLNDSDAALAHDLRVLVRQRLEKGDSDAAVKQHIVDLYGDYVLLDPPFKKTTFVLWLGPLFLLLCAVYAARVFLRSREGAAQPLSEKEQKRLAALLHEKKSEKRDITVYREQLAEVDNDIERGLLTKAQAEAVRTEIHRRMLAVEDAELAAVPGSRRPAGPRARKIYAALIAVLLPLMTAALYLWLGSPALPGRPFADRMNDPGFSLAYSAEEMKSKLEQTPSIEGYKHLAGTLSIMKHHAAAAEAYQKAVDLGDNDAVTWSEMGEEVVLANDGVVVSEALGDFYKALKQNPKDARARFYIGLAEKQIGNLKKAVFIWKKLLKDSAPDAPWIIMLKEHIEETTLKLSEDCFKDCEFP